MGRAWSLFFSDMAVSLADFVLNLNLGLDSWETSERQDSSILEAAVVSSARLAKHSKVRKKVPQRAIFTRIISKSMLP